jgi:hypothetical protein
MPNDQQMRDEFNEAKKKYGWATFNQASAAWEAWQAALSTRPHQELVEIGFTCERTGKRYSFPDISSLVVAFLIATRPQPAVSEWRPIGEAPKDGTEFYSLIDGLPYLSKYDEHGRFLRCNHGNAAPGASYRVHEINGVRLLEELTPAEYDYQKQWNIWKLGFSHKPSHWCPAMPLPPAPKGGDDAE